MHEGIKKIKDVGEYNQTKIKFNHCVEEYMWLINSDDPNRDVDKALERCAEELEKAQTLEDEIRVLTLRGELEAKKHFLEAGTYRNDIVSNIVAYTMELREFELSNNHENVLKSMWSAIRGDKKKVDELDDRFIWLLADLYGVQGPKSLDVVPPDTVRDELITELELVGNYDTLEENNDEKALAVETSGSIFSRMLYDSLNKRTVDITAEIMNGSVLRKAAKYVHKEQPVAELIKPVIKHHDDSEKNKQVRDNTGREKE